MSSGDHARPSGGLTRPTAEPTAASEAVPGAPVRGVAAVLVCLALAAAILAAVVIGDAALVAIGFAGPGAVTMIGGAVARTMMTLCAAMTAGSLLFAVVVAGHGGSGRLGVDAFRAWESARRWSIPWVVLCLVMVPFAAATSVGVPVDQLFSGRTLLVALGVSETAQGVLAAAILSLVVAIGTRVSLSWSSGVGLWAAAAAAAVAPMVTANSAQGAGHDVATSAAVVHGLAAASWIGGLWSMMLYLRARRTVADPSVICRFVLLSAGSMLALVVSGTVLTATTGGGFSTDTAYGRVLLAKVALTAVAVAGAGWATRRALRGARPPIGRVLIIQVAAIAVAFGLSSAMAQQPAPPAVTGGESQNELLIGYDLPDSPTPGSLATTWRFDLVIGLSALILLALYLACVLRLRGGGVRWPPGRTLAWTGGCLLVLLSTSSGLAAYAGALFSVHMIVHMTLSMAAPILLVLGGPVTLALQTLPPGDPAGGPRDRLVRVLSARPVRALTNPVVAIPVYGVTLFGLYFTGVLEVALRYHWGHLLMNGWFLVTGYLFYWAMIGIDPLPGRLPFIGRVAALVAIMPFDAIFGVLLMNASDLLAPQFYGSVDVPWPDDRLADQRLGGMVAWATGVLPLLVAVIALCVQWYRSDERSGRVPAAGSGLSSRPDDYQEMLDRLARMRH